MYANTGHSSLLLFLLSLLMTAPHLLAENIQADEWHSVLSITSETELFIKQIESGRLLRHFRIGHSEYLYEEAQRQAQELRQSTAEPDERKNAAFCIEQLNILSRDLKLLITKDTEEQTLAEALRDVEGIRKGLVAAGTCR